MFRPTKQGKETAIIRIENTGETTIENWSLLFTYESGIESVWNAVIAETCGSSYLVKNTNGIKDIQPGESLEFGLQSQMPFSRFPEKYELIGETKEAEDIAYTIIWNADIEKHEGTHYVIKNAGYNADIAGLSTISFGFMGNQGSKEDVPENFILRSFVTYDGDSFELDTDGDGLEDYDDIILGFSPLLQDTDGNGIWDSEEKLSQNLQKNFSDTEGHGVTKVEVAMDITGNIQNKVGIINVYEMDSLSRNVMGLVGVPVEIRCTETFDKATIKFTYDESVLENIEEENLAVLWYDEENNWYQILDQESVVDTENNTVSYTTTHFSTYMLVDSQAWYNAWRENIDYRNSGEGEENAHYFDIAFVVDVSGSMMGNNIRNAKTALNSFLDSLQDNDEAALISFNQKAFLLNDFTSSRVEVSKSITSLQADGGTNVNSGLVKALDIFEERENDRAKIVVLLCDGDVNYNQRTIDGYKEAGIQIYAVNVESNSAHRDLQKMAEQTNGQYFYGDGNELGKIFGQIQDSTVGRIDPTDEDVDGLYDIYETAGIKLPNGEIIKTDPTMPDTDGDSLTDLELFLTQQNDGYKAPLQDITYDKETGIISNDDYMKYAEYNRDNIYYLGGNYVNKRIGVLPGSMEAGLAYYLRTNNHPYTNVKWPPYSEMFRYAKNQTALTIEDMIDRNIPVVFSYHTFDKNEYLHLYRNIASARAMNMKDYERTVSHYMTIVGYQKYIDDTSMDYHYILKVVSWGEVYYVNYDEYMQKLSYVTNILSVGG